MDNIKKVLEVLGSVDVFYLATSVDGKPNVRPFDVHTDFEGKYEVDDESTAVFYFEDATLNLMEHGKEPVVIEF